MGEMHEFEIEERPVPPASIHTLIVSDVHLGSRVSRDRVSATDLCLGLRFALGNIDPRQYH